jgi:peptide/nickel transport system permease protein
MNASVPMPVAGIAELPVPKRRRFRWLDPLLHNPKALVGVGVLVIMVAAAILAPWITHYKPTDFVDQPHLHPSRTHWFGTEGQGKDVFSQTVYGARITLRIGFMVGILSTLVGMLVGMSAGYFRGRVDDVLSLIVNIFLIIPSLPLLIVLSAFMSSGISFFIIVLTLTGWAWPARIFRSQMLSLREKDFVSAAVVSGEGSPRIIFSEIMPNMSSIIVASFLGSTVYAIGAESGLEFLGLGNISQVTWGTNLYWATNNAGLLTGAWWTFVPAGLCIAIVAFALVMVNYAMDEITNPRIRSLSEAKNALKAHARRRSRATAPAGNVA